MFHPWLPGLFPEPPRRSAVLSGIHEVIRREVVSEFAGDHFAVGVADAEGEQGADVAKHGLADGERELVDVLMREREAERVFAGLGEDRREGVRGEVMKFVDEEEKVSALGFGLIDAGRAAS